MPEAGRSTTAAAVAREYTRIEQRVRAWAMEADEVRAAVVLGSRTREDHPADEFADLDVVVVIDDHARPYEDSGWLESIGEAWISFVERAADGSSPELRVLFAGGFDVDFAFMTVSRVKGLVVDDRGTAAVAFGRGHRVLVDRDGLVELMLAAASRPDSASPSLAADADAFARVCADFWYHAVWTAKHLRRGELWWAKGCCDGRLKELLRRVLEWEAAAEGRDPWFRGRFLDEWADPDVVAGLHKAFARYDESEVWSALFVTMSLFTEATRRTADELDLGYDEGAEARARELVERLHATGSFVE